MSAHAKDGNFSAVVFGQWNILRRISRHLRYRDLCSFSRLNRACREAATVSVASDPGRSSFSSFLWRLKDLHDLPKDYGNHLSASCGPSGASVSLVSSDVEGGSRAHAQLRQRWREFVAGLGSRPEAVVVFASLDTLKFQNAIRDEGDELHVKGFFVADVHKMIVRIIFSATDCILTIFSSDVRDPVPPVRLLRL